MFEFDDYEDFESYTSTPSNAFDNGYTQLTDDYTSLLLFIIFFMGIMAGLIVGSIMWRGN